MKSFNITEQEILSAIEMVLNENRKVIKTGRSITPMTQEPMQTQIPINEPTQQTNLSQEQGFDNNMEADGMRGNFDDGQFDNNFDAGVEADEDAEPKKYIQQLTGKLSQKLNSYNKEQDGDNELNKYVVNMIISATCKNLDEKSKKEIIKKIKSLGDDSEPENSNEEESLNERIYTKGELKEMFCSTNNEDTLVHQEKKLNKKMPKAWQSKF